MHIELYIYITGLQSWLATLPSWVFLSIALQTCSMITDHLPKMLAADEKNLDTPPEVLKKPTFLGSNFSTGYPLVNKHNYGKTQVLMGISTINGHFQ